MRVELRDGDGAELRRRAGAEPKAVAPGGSRQFVDEWVGRFRRPGLAGLAGLKARGRPPALTRAELAAFKARIKAGPTAADGGKSVLRGGDARRILAEEFGKPTTLGSAYRLLHRAGLSHLRPRHRKTDPVALAAWLAAAPLLPPPNASCTPAPSPTAAGRAAAVATRTRSGSGRGRH